jgi:(p)ppGpp synthase/HD superfamily hydrolase
MPAGKKPEYVLGERFESALVYATRLHRKQRRKSSEIPYVAHLLGVTALVLEDGGDEDEAIAALLHDAVEDQGGLDTLEDIRMEYGERVAHIVLAISDSYQQPKPPWLDRKKAYIESLENATPAVVRVSLADTVYNARSTLEDLRREGEAAWNKFNGGKEGTLWYYDQLIHAFSRHGQNPLLSELERVMEQIRTLTT